jgi:FKBP-type peptidyl-prolyl cis-trans isomerase
MIFARFIKEEHLFRRTAALTAVVALAICAGALLMEAQQKTAPAKKPSTAAPTPVTGDPVVTKSGLKYWDIKAGDGAEAVRGKRVSVHYTGWFTSGKKFDSSVDRGQPFEFRLGAGEVIRGWDEGVAGMKVGGKRQLNVKPELAYGSRGYPGAIPPNSTLIFDVELLAVR